MEKLALSKLNDVERTALLILAGRSVESKSGRYIKDKKAEEILDSIDYDTSMFDNFIYRRELRKFAMRAILYDSYVKPFIEQNPELTVIEVGCGLSTCFDRLDNGRLKWFDIDLPNIMEIRKHFFEDTDRHKNLGISILDNEWIGKVKENSKPPFVFVSQGVLPYFEEKEVKNLFTKIADNFPESYYIFENMTDFALKLFKKSSMYKKHINASVIWSVNDIYELEKWDKRFKIIRHASVMDLPKEMTKKFPAIIRITIPLMSKMFKKYVNSMCLNTIKLS